MDFIAIILGIILLLVLVTFLKLDTFISFILVCLFVGLFEGLSVTDTLVAIQNGIGNTLGSLVIILGFGAMLGKLVAESGAANEITNQLVKKFGIQNVQLALMVTGFIVGIPMFYLVGFVILVPLAIAIASKTKLPLLYVGMPMLASLSVTHGFLPPHPAPTAIAETYGADIGLTLIYGMIVGIPAIFAAKFALAKTMKRIVPRLPREYDIETDDRYKIPSLGVSLTVALLPVILIGGASALALYLGDHPIINSVGDPAFAMLISVLAAIYFLGLRTGRSMADITRILANAVSGIAVVLLIIAGAGSLKEVMVETQISDRIGEALGGLGMSPLVLAWMIAGIIHISVGSATVAALTAASIVSPMLGTSDISPELLVLATGAGSLILSHVNDGGFWLFKEYLNVSIKETLLSWTLMETTIAVVGLLGILLLDLLI
jgi:Gnt-I system high-affinity gluconate transporter